MHRTLDGEDFQRLQTDGTHREALPPKRAFRHGRQDYSGGVSYSIIVVNQLLNRIVQRVPDDAFARTGVHSVDGPISLQSLLERITNHIPHHVQFIREKRAALEQGGG